MNYCPHCGEKLPKDEVKRPLQPGLPIPPADDGDNVWGPGWSWPPHLPAPIHWPPTPAQRGWDVIS